MGTIREHPLRPNALAIVLPPQRVRSKRVGSLLRQRHKSELFGTRVPGSVTLRQRLKSLISGTESFVALPARKEQPNQIDTVAPLITALRCYGVDQWKIQYFLKLTLEVSVVPAAYHNSFDRKRLH